MINLAVTLTVLLLALTVIWFAVPTRSVRARRVLDRLPHAFAFPLNNTSSHARVLSKFRRGHLTAQDDRVELTLVGDCVTANLYAYRSRGWYHGPLNGARLILGIRPVIVVRHDARMAFVLAAYANHGVMTLSVPGHRLDVFDVTWQPTNPAYRCPAPSVASDRAELARIFDSFRIAPRPPTPGAGPTL